MFEVLPEFLISTGKFHSNLKKDLEALSVRGPGVKSRGTQQKSKTEREVPTATVPPGSLVLS